MIEVKIRPDEITLFGHANYAVAGQDIVWRRRNGTGADTDPVDRGSDRG